MLGIGKHVSDLLSAVGSPNIGARVSTASMNKAVNTALRRGGSTPQSMGRSVTQTVRPTIHRGSTAGWKGQKTVHLNPNNSGYANPSYQKARYRKTSLTYPTASTINSRSGVSYSKSVDYRYRRGL